MDALEKINKKFGDWYGKFFASGEETGLQPAQIKRRLFTAMEDERTEGLDHQTYVPNVYTLKVAVTSEKERQYVRTFLQADDLAQILADRIAGQGYLVKGNLVFLLEEVDPTTQDEKLQVSCAFDPTAVATNSPVPSSLSDALLIQMQKYKEIKGDEENEKEDLGTVAAVFPKSSPSASLSSAPASLLITHSDGRMEEMPLEMEAQAVEIGRGKQAGNHIILNDLSRLQKTRTNRVWKMACLFFMMMARPMGHASMICHCRPVFRSR